MTDFQAAQQHHVRAAIRLPWWYKTEFLRTPTRVSSDMLYPARHQPQKTRHNALSCCKFHGSPIFSTISRSALSSRKGSNYKSQSIDQQPDQRALDQSPTPLTARQCCDSGLVLMRLDQDNRSGSCCDVASRWRRGAFHCLSKHLDNPPSSSPLAGHVV